MKDAWKRDGSANRRDRVATRSAALRTFPDLLERSASDPQPIGGADSLQAGGHRFPCGSIDGVAAGTKVFGSSAALVDAPDRIDINPVIKPETVDGLTPDTWNKRAAGLLRWPRPCPVSRQSAVRA